MISSLYSAHYHLGKINNLFTITVLYLDIQCVYFDIFLLFLELWKNAYAIKFILSVRYSGIKYICIFVQLSPPSIHRSLFILHRCNSLPLEFLISPHARPWQTSFYVLSLEFYYSI